MPPLTAFWKTCAAAGLLAAAAPAQSFLYPDFASTAGLHLLGNAMRSGTALRLTANAANQSGWAWRQVPVPIANGFSTSFTFRITPPAIGTKGEGLAFVIHGDPAGAAAIGGTAWGLGYGIGASGSTSIRNSIVIELDTYADAFLGDTSANELSIHTGPSGGSFENEQFSIARNTPASVLSDGLVHLLEVHYVPGTIEVFVDGATAPAISRPYHHVTGGTYLTGGAAPGAGIANQIAWVGFCATTGAGTLAELVEILSWQWTSTSAVHPCYSGSLQHDVLTVQGQEGGLLRTVGLTTWQSFAIGVSSPVTFGPGAPWVLLLSFAAQPGALGTQLGFGEMCFPVLPPTANEFVLADSFGVFAALLPAQPAPYTIAVPAGVVTAPVDFTLQGITMRSASPLELGVTNAVHVDFQVGPAPTIQQVVPLSAPVGQPITVTGTNFVPGVSVRIAGVPQAPSSATATQVTFAYPTGVPCAALLEVVNPDAQAATGVLNPQPTVTSTLLGSGSAAGNQVFVVLGSGFAPGTTVTIGGAPAMVISVSTTTITMRTPPGTPGVAPVVVTTPGGCSVQTSYTYL
ncbi:MAG TPA: IPT/TIG domain-containing protein [Planctomycetota bacterium]|nr:IPT/TIG domain-containing protein [Planctomycetota bacterium]